MLDIFTEALLKSHTREGILDSVQESKQDFLEKGKKAQIGEIREWKGQKFQKQPNGGWIPVKQGQGGTKSSEASEGTKNVKSSFGELMSKSDEEIAKILQEVVGLKASIWGPGDKKAPSEGDFWFSTSTEGVNDGLRKRLMIRPITKEGRERLTDDSVKKKLKKLVGVSLGSWSCRGASGERIFQGYEMWESDADFERKKNFVKRFFDPQELVNGFEESFDLSEGVEEFERWLNDRQNRDNAVDVLVDQTDMGQEDAMKMYDKKTAAALEEIKKNPEKYGFETSDLNKKVIDVKDWIGDEASDQEISDVLSAVEDFVSPSMLKIQANSPLQFGEKVYDRADEIIEKYREHFDHWDGTDSMPDKQLRKILVAIMYDKRNPRA